MLDLQNKTSDETFVSKVKHIFQSDKSPFQLNWNIFLPELARLNIFHQMEQLNPTFSFIFRTKVKEEKK